VFRKNQIKKITTSKRVLLVKEEKIKIGLIDRLFKIYNADRTKNGKVT